MIEKPENRLWAEVVRYAFKDLREGTELDALEAYSWLTRESKDELNGFINICDSLGLSAEAIRKKARRDLWSRKHRVDRRVGNRPEHRVEALGV
jgi:hypothetical protein